MIHNAVDLDRIPFVERPDRDLVIVGRMTPGKGIGEALRLARRAGRAIDVVAPVMKNLAESRPYFEREVRPLLDGAGARHIPGLPNDETVRLVGRCRAFLFPLQWEEPFGMTVVESMAAGTPVIAYRRGAMPELIEDGVTGFLCDTPEEMIHALDQVDAIDRRRCRQRVAERFGVERLADDYEALYRRLLAGG